MKNAKRRRLAAFQIEAQASHQALRDAEQRLHTRQLAEGDAERLRKLTQAYAEAFYPYAAFGWETGPDGVPRLYAKHYRSEDVYLP